MEIVIAGDKIFTLFYGHVTVPEDGEDPHMVKKLKAYYG